MTDQAHNLAAQPRFFQRTDGARLKGGWLRLARLTWVVLACLVLAVLLAAMPGYAAKWNGQLAHSTGVGLPPSARFFAAASGLASLASALLSIGLAALLFRQRFTETIAAFLSFYLLIYGAVMSGPLELASYHWLGSTTFALRLQGILLAAPMIALLMLFPTGHFVPRWTRWLVLLSIPFSFLSWLVAPFDAATINRYPFLSGFVSVIFLALFLTGGYAQIYRYRKVSSLKERRQTRWAIMGFGLFGVYILFSTIPFVVLTSLPPGAPTPWWGPASELGWWLSLNILPVFLTIAITRHQLWDIDLVVNRTLVYGALTTSLLAVYALIVGGMGLLFHAQDNLIMPVLASGLAAVLFQPLRQRFQRGINRLMYGDRDDPAVILQKLGAQLEGTASAEAALSRIVETVAQALKLPYTAIQLGDDATPAASFGLPTHPPRTFPLIYQGESIGWLAVTGRDPDGEFTFKDIQLLENIARQTGLVAYNVRLTADLQRSRQKIVTAREEERRRIRRDLHDGLGAQLAGQTLTLDAVEKLIQQDPDTAKMLVQNLKLQTGEAMTDVRRLIYDLRPPVLDDLGLAAALQQEWERNAGGSALTGSPVIDLEVPVPLPTLPAAAELAAYRIIQEAVNNVLKHAGAQNCTVSVEVREAMLNLSVTDDGRGLPENVKSGVGFHSMRERAEELGGWLRVENSAAGGVRIIAALPILGEESG